jgi:hypothetical protein
VRLKRQRRRSRSRASVLIDSVVGIIVALIAAYIIDQLLPIVGLENWDSADQITNLVQRARSDANLQGDAALFITTASGAVTIQEAAATAGGTLTDPYTGTVLGANESRTFTGSMTATVNGTAEALPLTIAVSPSGALYAPPTGAATPCTTIQLTLTYTATIGTVTVPETIACGL